MSKAVVLLVHGMGTHAPGNIKKEFIKGVNQAGTYLAMDDFDIAKEVKFEEYNYSDKLDRIRKDAADYQGNISQYLNYVSGGTLGDIATKLVDIEAKFGNDSFLYTHWLDVAYYGLTYHHEEIRLEWAEELSKQILYCHKNGTKLHVVGHSLGTAVVHDALAKLYRERVGLGDSYHLSAASERFESLWMVANVSRLVHILTRSIDPHHSITHDSNPDMVGCANYFYNVRNKFDPFMFVKKYKREIEHGRHIEFSEVRKIENNDLIVNPHDLTEYMACPDVSRLFLYRTLGKRFSREQLRTAMEAYHADSIQGIGEQAYDAIMEFVDSLGDLSLNNIDTVINAFESAKKAIDDLRNIAN